MFTDSINTMQAPMERRTQKFINLYRLGGMNNNRSTVILFNWTTTDADSDSGNGNIISASDSYTNGNAEPWKRPANVTDNAIVTTLDSRIGLS